jgi:hypothetical protein
MDVTRHERVEELPGGWDALAAHLFQRRAFLAHCERENPCRQRYYVAWRDGAPTAGAIVYRLPLDLLTFLGVRSPLAMNVVGVPCSVASPGLLGEVASAEALLRDVLGAERGMTLALNLHRAPPAFSGAVGRTWPGIVLAHRFAGFEEYRRSLRAPYRRRLDRILAREATLRIETGPCAAFGGAEHAQYLEVLARSEGKLERLSERFFRTLPDPFRLTTFREGGRLRGWVVTVPDRDRFWFFLGGQDHEADARELYLVKLLAVLRQGIAAGARVIDLGQSAEVPKLRLGGAAEELTMLGWHSARPARAALRLAAPLLSYRRRLPTQHVFREGTP